MAQFKAMLKSFDKDSYNLKMKQTNEKIKLYNDAIQWASNWVDVGDPNVSGIDYDVFEKDMITEFKRALLEKQKQHIQIPISADKLIYMMDVPINELVNLAEKYYSNNSNVNLKEGVMTPVVDKKKYQQWTTSEKENDKLRLAKKFIDVIEQVEQESKVFPLDIARRTSHFVGYDIRSNKWRPNNI
mgnify:CR=1 FL=1